MLLDLFYSNARKQSLGRTPFNNNPWYPWTLHFKRLFLLERVYMIMNSFFHYYETKTFILDCRESNWHVAHAYETSRVGLLTF